MSDNRLEKGKTYPVIEALERADIRARRDRRQSRTDRDKVVDVRVVTENRGHELYCKKDE